MCDHIVSACRSGSLEFRRIGSLSFPYRRGNCWIRALMHILEYSSLQFRPGWHYLWMDSLTAENTKLCCSTDRPKTVITVWHFSWRARLASCCRTHCLATGNSFGPLFWWHYTTFLFLFSVVILTPKIPSFFLLKLLTVTCVNLKHASTRSFQHQAPRVWNSLPLKIHLFSSLSSFKSQPSSGDQCQEDQAEDKQQQWHQHRDQSKWTETWDSHKFQVPGLSYNWWGFRAWDTLWDSTGNSSSIDKVEISLEWQEHFSQFQDATNVLPCHIHPPVCLWIMDPHSRAPMKNTSHGNEVLPQDTIQKSLPRSSRQSDHMETSWPL